MAKGANIKNTYIISFYTRDTYIKYAYTGNTYTKSTCTKVSCIKNVKIRYKYIKNTCITEARNGYTKNIYIKDTCTRDAWNICTRDIYTNNAYFIRSACIKNVDISGIYSSAHKSIIKNLKLLIKLISKMLVSFYLFLQEI